jgi:hypothetical protein
VLNSYTLNKMESKLVHISTIRVGDTVKCKDGHMRTIGKNNLGNGFCGHTIFGDSYRMGTQPVEKIIFKKPSK